MSDDGSQQPKPTFVKRSRPRGGGALGASSRSRPTEATLPGSSATASKGAGEPRPRAPQEDDDDDDGAAGVVQRSLGPRGRGIAGPSSRLKPNVSRKQSTTVLSFDGSESAAGGSPVERSVGRIRPLGLPTNLDQASLQDSATTSIPTSYSSEALADLRAATQSLRHNNVGEPLVPVDEDGNALELAGPAESGPTAYQTLTLSGSGAPTPHFGAGHLDASEGIVPSQSVIAAAKERRRKAAAAAASGGDAPSNSIDDFVPLESGKSGERSLSRYDGRPRARGDDSTVPTLQREDDEMGSGDDDFADFTGAQETIPLKASQRRLQEARLRKERQEQVAGDPDTARYPGVDESEDEGEEDFEHTQLRRLDGLSGSRKQLQECEKSPYRAAPLPAAIPLPGPGSAASRINLQLAQVEASLEVHEKVIDDANHALEQLDEGESSNKASVQEWHLKEAWARELTTFIESLAAMMEEKATNLQQIEADFLALCEDRARVVQRARAREMEDELALFWGVPQSSVLPSRKTRAGASLDGDQMDTAGESQEAGDNFSPTQDGDATSPIRSQRREASIVPPNQAGVVLREVSLSPEDAAAFDIALDPIERKWRGLMDGVKAPEFLWPDARLPTAGTADEPGTTDGNDEPHPASVHTRFLDWRRRFPQDYAKAWGGLALSGVWEFWAQRELALWDPFRAARPNSTPRDLESSSCLEALQHYAEASTSLSADGATAEGGDDEAVSSLVNTVFVARLVASAGAFDPWSSAQTIRVVSLCVQVMDFLPKEGPRFQRLVGTYLACFETQIKHIEGVFAVGPALSAPAFHPLSIPARLAFSTRLVAPAATPNGESGLLFNLFRFWRLSSGSADNRRLIESLVDTLLSRIAWDLLRQGAETGGSRLAASILERTPVDIPLQADLRSRLGALVSSRS
ncbi:unnamed protein product [Parajaminaea phylloscopi]